MFDNSFSSCWGEVPLSYYYDSAPAKLEEVPPELLSSLEEIEPPGPIVYRKRITRDEYNAMWRW
ncbi:MAG: hypothetical protein K0R61_3619 [Microvirga sp.]|nr:hypothetical protein [Microvirga sp.]